MQELHIPFGYVADFQDVMSSPQLEARGFLAELDHPVAGRQRYPSAPFQAADVDWRLEPAQTLGQHNVEVYLDRLGLSEGEYTELLRRGVV